MELKDRKCKNCGFGMCNAQNHYICLNPNPMVESPDASFPVNPEGTCSWHRFPYELFD